MRDRRSNRVGGRRPLELRIARHHSPSNVDLLELSTCVAGLAGDDAVRLVHTIAALAGDIDRPKLTADVTRLEPGEVGHARRALTEVVGFDIHRMVLVFANAPGQIVMSVDDRLCGQDADRACHVWIRGRLRPLLLSTERRRGDERREGEESEGHFTIIGAGTVKSETRRAIDSPRSTMQRDSLSPPTTRLRLPASA